MPGAYDLYGGEENTYKILMEIPVGRKLLESFRTVIVLKWILRKQGKRA
jgi:hypothetical protein